MLLLIREKANKLYPKGGFTLKDDQLKYILQQIDLAECEEVIENYIYYSRRPVRQRCSHGDGGKWGKTGYHIKMRKNRSSLVRFEKMEKAWCFE